MDFRKRGQHLAGRGVVADKIGMAVTALAFVFALLYLVKFRKLSAPISHRITRSWKPMSLLYSCFLLFIVSTIVGVNFQFLVGGFPSVSVLLWSILFMGIPAVGLGFRFCPGWHAVHRVFRIRMADLAHNLVPYLAIAGYGLFLSFLASEALAPVEMVTGMVDVRDFVQIDMFDPATQISSLFTLIICAPYFEELIYRGFIFTALKNRFGPVLSALISSAIFATYHWYSLLGWISVFISGLIFCFVANRTGSLWPGMIIHGVFNLYVWITINGWYAWW